MSFTLTLGLVATMLAYAVPTFLLMKAKLVKESAIQGIAAILLYVCTPAVIIHSFKKATFNNELLKDLFIFLGLSLFVQIFILLVMYLILKKRFDDPRARIASAASALGNCGFFGLPLLHTLVPDKPHVVVYAAVISVFMNFIAFTFGLVIMSGETKYISLKKIFFNPGTLSAIVAIPLFILNVEFPAQLMSALELFVNMSTPLCMFVLGMRLATVKITDVFLNPYSYLAVIIKQLVMPLLALGLTLLLPCDPTLEIALIILCACPVATLVLNLSEIIEQGQKYAVNTVLLGTILSIITIPIIMALC